MSEQATREARLKVLKKNPSIGVLSPKQVRMDQTVWLETLWKWLAYIGFYAILAFLVVHFFFKALPMSILYSSIGLLIASLWLYLTTDYYYLLDTSAQKIFSHRKIFILQSQDPLLSFDEIDSITVETKANPSEPSEALSQIVIICKEKENLPVIEAKAEAKDEYQEIAEELALFAKLPYKSDGQ